ncbi:class I SAM-dependent methyltransferase [Mycobacterium pseudokansasii]|uniref:class I SAM-dependent methyltransferase n=1 Tax=Mycobacterium pseudokansasii TaxID=2341080 RepID=UPI0007B51E67|nr:SAM-dependent methyltransferase [Mycobacterium pseudokansasii]KZS63881.1 methyltransferase [Mycobacterium kansasii]VAZ95969.1 Putative S-adenosyl-L-methionine-dependent methyltransferase [Mycobacterium pseudokansasii]VAZ97298.1 Putative S-adenosyl-L-methionine-dependent methyltransferase [Mycobacterium pseudokansasii]
MSGSESGDGHVITHVSDTARLTALHRATESARPDALFSDPLAQRLAGQRGRAIVRHAPWTLRNGWWLVARTKIIDDTLARAIADGCDRVLNLAAGLDTRPYRLNLPSRLRWIEADLPQLLAEKTELLADQTPRCQLTRSAVDLADPLAREAFFTEALDGAANALVLTEGLLMYLDEQDVVALSEAIRRPEVGWWMLDFAGPGLKKMMNNRMAGMLENAPFIFAPDNGLAFFESLGWRVTESESLFAAAIRFHRLPKSMRTVAWFPQPDPRHPGRRPWSAVALLTQ